MTVMALWKFGMLGCEDSSDNLMLNSLWAILVVSPRRAWSVVLRRCSIFVKCAINQGTQCNWNTNYSCLFRYQHFCYSISCLNTFVTVYFESILIQLSRNSPKIIWHGQSPKTKQMTIKISEGSERKRPMETQLQITTQMYLCSWFLFKVLKWGLHFYLF